MLDRTVFALHEQASRCAVATGAETVEIWRLPDGPARKGATEPESKIETERSPIRGVAFVASGYLMTIHQLGECAIWKLPERRELPTGDAGGDSAGKSSDDVPAPSEATDSGKSEVPATTGEQTPQETDAESDSDSVPVAEERWSRQLGIEAAVFRARARDGGTADRFAIGGRDGALVIGAIDTSKANKPVFGIADAHDTDVTALAFAPRSERLATGGRDKRIAIWSTNPSEFQARSTSDSKQEGSDEMSESDGEPAETDGSADSDESPKIEETLDAPSIPRRLELEGSEGWPLAIQFSNDGTRLASAALDNSLYLWDPRADEPLQAVVNRHDNWVTELSWSPDDARIATGSWDTSVGLYQADDLSPEYRFDLHTDFVSGLVFVDDPPRLITASYDGRLGIWDWSSGELANQIRAHADWIEVLVPLGDVHLLTVSSEDVLRIWNAATGERVAELGDASFEGFDLGRAVDFSDYVDVPELSSDELGGDEDSRFGLDPVEELTRSPSETDATSRSAVGLLEKAIETSLPESSTPELGEDSAGPRKELLEARIDGEPGEAAAPASTSEKEESSTLPDPDETGVPEPAEGDEVEEAISEISEVNLDELKTKEDDSGTDGAEAQSNAAESVDQFGESIDDRVEDTSLDMPDDVDSAAQGEEVKLDGSEEADEPAPGASESDLHSPGSLGDEASPHLGSPVDDSNGRNSESPGDATPTGPPRSADDGEASSEMSGSVAQRSRDRDRDVGGETLTGSGPSAPGASTSSPEGADQEARPDSESRPRDERETSSETEGSDASEPSADDLKEKFRKLKQQESDDGSDSDS